ncbi:MAG: DUF3467 domain-containing protein [Ktedonobacteraceae bacterium]
MATKPEVDPRVFQTPPVNRRAPDHKTIYSNVIRTGITPFDVRIVFGQVAEPTPGDPAQQIDDLTTVIMSAEEAKAMISIVQQAVQGYEALYGEIRDIMPLLERMKAEAIAKATPVPAEPTVASESTRKSKKN